MKKYKHLINVMSLAIMLVFSSIPLYALNDINSEEVVETQVVNPVTEEETLESVSETNPETNLVVEEVVGVQEETEAIDVSLLAEIPVESNGEEIVHDELQNETKVVLQEKATSVSLFANVNNIQNVQELMDAITAADDGDTLTLSNSFVSGSLTIALTNKSITIDGNAITWNGGSITIIGNGTLTLKNFKMNGEQRNSRLLTASLSSGVINIENMEFFNSSGGALDLKTPKATQVNIINSKIHNNTAGAGPAIFLAGGTKVLLSYTTIDNNSGTAAAYEAGAIASKNFSGVLEINNSVLTNNTNKAVNTGIVGGVVVLFQSTISLKR